MKRKKNHEVNVLTGQLVSQLMYQASRLKDDDFQEVTSEILKLINSYEKKVKNLKK